MFHNVVRSATTRRNKGPTRRRPCHLFMRNQLTRCKVHPCAPLAEKYDPAMVLLTGWPMIGYHKRTRELRQSFVGQERNAIESVRGCNVAIIYVAFYPVIMAHIKKSCLGHLTARSSMNPTVGAVSKVNRPDELDACFVKVKMIDIMTNRGHLNILVQRR